MKRILIVAAASLMMLLPSASLKAQNTYNCNSNQYRYIEVTGTSEVEIVPDEIHFVIGIKEYFEEDQSPYRDHRVADEGCPALYRYQ